MSCPIAKANVGLCGGGQLRRWMSSSTLRDSRRSTWKSINGECLPFQSRNVGVKRSKALTASVALSVLFLIVYGGCNWITTLRANVGSFYFDWEKNIPFV